MKYTTDEALIEIVRRGKMIRKKRADQITRSLCACISALMIVFIGAFSIFAECRFKEMNTYYGSLVFSSDIGLYILIAVLSFWLGILVAVILVTVARKNGKNKHPKS